MEGKVEIDPDLADLLGSREWRLNNLYRIIDKNGDNVQFTMNPAQWALWEGRHNFNIILKARQLGFSTFIGILFLDAMLFTDNWQAGIIAHSLNDAKKLLQTKIRFPYDNLPIEIKRARRLTTDSKTELQFSNGSGIQVGTSLRSQTLQGLHISEMGKIAYQFPSKAVEIKTGALNAIAFDQIVFVESTHEGGKSGMFYDMCRNAMALRGKSLTPLDPKFFFFPWHKDPGYAISDDRIEIPDDDRRYFMELAVNEGIDLSDDQKRWYSMKHRQQGFEMRREYPSTPEEAFDAAIEGAYYSREVGEIYSKGRLCSVPYDPSASVFTAWDLGIDDYMAIWWIQVVGKEIHLVDYYQNHGYGFEHYANILTKKRDDRRLAPLANFCPWDINQRELSSGLRRVESARQLGINFTPVPRMSLERGIETSRQLLSMAWVDQDNCIEGFRALEAYHQKKDETTGEFTKTPVHDWSSHGADAFRTFANAWENGDVARMVSSIDVDEFPKYAETDRRESWQI